MQQRRALQPISLVILDNADTPTVHDQMSDFGTTPGMSYMLHTRRYQPQQPIHGV